jgi:ABC-type Fe3+ transport system substrate-binding protein
LFLNTETIAYNPKQLAAAHMPPPKTWSDFTKPEWRGKFALFSGSYEWYAAMLKAFGNDKGEALARSLAANGAKLVNSHQQAENMLVAGEYVGAVNTYGYDIAREQSDGGAINVNPDPTVVEVHGIGVVARAPHPEAARLFMKWAVGREAQTFVAQTLGRISARKDVKNNPAIWNPHMHLVVSDPAESVHYADYAKAFNSIFGVAG